MFEDMRIDHPNNKPEMTDKMIKISFTFNPYCILQLILFT